MKLISCLVSGVAGAEVGTVDIYSRGTTFRATQYANFEGGGAFVPANSTSLDSLGGAVVYVNEYVDCVVRDAGGDIVRTFTDGSAASTVEVQTPSFTGTDYYSGSTSPDYPSPLSAIMDRWIVSAGAIDWQVAIGGNATSLETAFAAFAGMFYNVKSPTYGATGGGIADDASAIQAAVTAAAVTGGVVFFPAGTYRVTTAINMPSNVSLLGSGANATIITMDAPHTSVFLYATSTSSRWVSIRGMSITCSQVYTTFLDNALVMLTEAACVLVDECNVGGTLLRSGCFGSSLTVAAAHSARLVVRNTSMLSSSPSFVSDGYGFRTFISCQFVMTSNSLSGTTIDCTASDALTVIGCAFDGSLYTTNTFYYIAGPQTVVGSTCTVIGSTFKAPSSGSGNGISFAQKSGLQETGNYFPTDSTFTAITAIPFAGLASSRAGNILGSRSQRKYRVASDAATISLDVMSYGSAVVRRTTNANQTVNFSTTGLPGQMFTLTYDNGNAGAIATVTMDASVRGLTTFGINGSTVSTYVFVSQDTGTGTGTYWFLVGTGTVNVSAP